jgi:hypothetical protein
MQKQITSIYGYQQITSLSSSTGLTVPTTDVSGLVGSPVVAIIRCETQGVRWRDDGVAPTAAVGFPLSPGDVLMYDGDLKRIKFIQQAASSTLNVVYYS